MVATAGGRDNDGSEGIGEAPPASVGEALQRCHGVLDKADIYLGHGTDNPWDESVQLVLGALALPPDSGDEVLAMPLEPERWMELKSMLNRRVDGREPLPYILGKAWFAGLEFACDPRALVPRSPLGELISSGYAPWWSGEAPLEILDLCCGGGCIGIAAAVYEPQARVVLADLDAAALDLARENIERHAVSARVSVQRSNLFSQLEPRTFDLILCNPPYVDAADIAAMPPEYRMEPLHALEAGDDGLDLALEILVEAPRWLAEAGLLFLELGNSWAALDALCESLPLTWLEFAEGGHGVLCIGRDDLVAAGPHFTAVASRRGYKRV